jgi:hypothetical protein
MDVAAENDGGVLVATGSEGRLYKIEPQTWTFFLLTGVDARQITRFAAPGHGAPLHGVCDGQSRAGRRRGRRRAVALARYVSSVRDTKTRCHVGPPSMGSDRSGCLSSRGPATPNDRTIRGVNGPARYTKREGEMITSPAARFLQWRAVFTSQGSAPPAQLTAVTVAYLPRNSRPVINSVTVHPPGVVFQRPFVNDESAIAGLDEAGRRRSAGHQAQAMLRHQPPAAACFKRASRTIARKADDEDADKLVYALQYRAQGETAWRDLKAGLSDAIFVWDTSTVPDGRYVVKIPRIGQVHRIPPIRALAGEQESDVVNVDNTPPAITIQTVRQGATIALAVHIVDARSPVQKVEYSLGGAAWRIIYPIDGLADSLDERFEIPIAAESDISLIVIRATDGLLKVNLAARRRGTLRGPATTEFTGGK